LIRKHVWHLIFSSTPKRENKHVPLLKKISSNKKHLKNVGPIHHCEPPHANSPDVASGTVVRRLRIDVYDNADDDDDNDDNDNA